MSVEIQYFDINSHIVTTYVNKKNVKMFMSILLNKGLEIIKIKG